MPSSNGPKNSAQMLAVTADVVQTPQQLAERVDELQQANAEIRAARRAAPNLMEDAVQSEAALRASEAKYRTLFARLYPF